MQRIEKPWGYELIWAQSSNRDGYVGKLLHINSGNRLSFQFHEKKEETIYVKSGCLYVETRGFVNPHSNPYIFEHEKKIIKLDPGECLHIKPLFTHRFTANEQHVELIEVSTKYLEDVVRLEDDYGRGR